MTILCQNLTEVNEICEFFHIPINVGEIEITFPYPFELKTIDGEKIENENEYTFEQWKNKYIKS